MGLETPQPGAVQDVDASAMPHSGQAGTAPPSDRFGIRTTRIVPGNDWNVAIYDLSPRPAPRRRILVMQLGHFGDFIISLPALHRLRHAYPEDTIRLVVGSWNKDDAEACGVADDVATYDFFPEVARHWDGKPAQGLDRFQEIVSGSYDIAIDLRVSEDTRFLLQHVDAQTRCGIGAPVRFPFLQVVLPYDYGLRRNDSAETITTLLLGPERFHSRMPVQGAFRHETDFRVSNQHLIFGPYMRLPPGRYRATFGLHTLGARLGLWRVTVKLEVGFGADGILAERILRADQIGTRLTDAFQLEFTNPDEQGGCEFRIRVTSRPVRGRMAFYGVRIDRLDAPVAPRLKPADLHIGEQMSMLVQLVADRTRPLYASPPDPPARHLPASCPPIPEGRHRVAIAPVSNSDLRDWPLRHYAALTRLLVEKLDCTVILIGSRAQHGALAEIVAASGPGHRAVNLAGRTAWQDVPSLLHSADLVICNNSGVAHLAASLGLRTLAIYAASHQPQEWGPRGAQARAIMAQVPCSPCGYDKVSECDHGHACMQGLLPEVVFEQAASWLAA